MGAENAKNGCSCLYGGLFGVLLFFIAAGALLGCVVNRCVLYYANVKKEAIVYGECIRATRYIG